ncbi:MAG: peptidase M6 [Anaerolineales bacterium]|nr:peptidase M6 [Anaerolineales bacterium]
MKRKTFSMLAILALLLGLMAAAIPASAGPKLPDPRPVDVGPEVREWEATPERIGNLSSYLFDETLVGSATESVESACITDTKIWLFADFYTGYYYLDVFGLMAEGSESQIWVQLDLSWPLGDPRPTPVITCDQAAYMVDEFDNNMYPTMVDFFGPPDAHDGSAAILPGLIGEPPDYYYDEDGRQVVLVENVRDNNYYDPTYPLYVAGFYSSSLEAYFDRNTMTIDAYDWENRTGPDAPRPYLYEGVFAHEYQHLLHDDYDPDEENFVNEGLSMFSEYLTGYATGEEQYGGFLTNPENSLVVWEDQGNLEVLSDYGQAYLFQFYMMEKFGQGFLQTEFMNPDNGITGINTTLDAHRIRKDFGDVYHDFAVAVLIDSKQANYRYGFEDLEVMIDIGTPGSPNPDAYDYPGAPPWGTDYIWLDDDPKELAKFTFDGIDYSLNPTAWTSNGDILWSGTGNLIDNWAIFEATGGGSLTFDTYWDIEDYWDFGFVQVSTDGGHNWTSLANAYTTDVHDPNAHPDIIANLPGLTSWSCFVEPDCWVNMSFDLSAYSGDILLAFRYMTDWATLYDGWYIDNVYVDSTLISDGSNTDPFKDISEILPVENDFTVTFVGIKEKGKGNQYKVHTMKLSDATEEGLFELNKIMNWSDKAVMLVTFDAPEGFTEYADYDYSFTFTNAGPKK